MAAAQPAGGPGERAGAGERRRRPPHRLGVSPVQGGARLRRLRAEPAAGTQDRGPARGGLGHADGSDRERRADLHVSPADQRQRLQHVRGGAQGPAPRGEAGGGPDAGSVGPAPGAGVDLPAAGRRHARRHRDPCPAIRGVPAGGPAERHQHQAQRSHGHPARGRHRSRRRGVRWHRQPGPQRVHHPGLRPDRQPTDHDPGRLPRAAAPRPGRPAPVPERGPGHRSGGPGRP